MTYSVLPLGGCPLNIPLATLRNRRAVKSVFQDIGFQRWPLAVSSTDALQLLKFARGDIDIPMELQHFTYYDQENRPKPGLGHLLEETEIILVEISTPMLMRYRGLVLNHNYVNNFLIDSSKEDPEEIRKKLMQWRYQGIQLANSAVRESLGAELLAHFRTRYPDDHFLIRLLEELNGDTLTADDMTRDLKEIRDTFDRPMGLILHHYNYMPGARPVSYPPSFTGDLRMVVANLGLPSYDPAILVKQHGTDAALAKDMRHYTKEFYDIIADDYLTFIQQILGR